jgi:hypothetical protein
MDGPTDSNVFGVWEGKSKKLNLMIKTVSIYIGIGFIIVVFVVSPVIEKHPSPHTGEPSFSSQPIPTLVMESSGSYTPVRGAYTPVRGSYTPATFYSHTGSWV